MGLNYAIFSGATLDPWVDLIGIPKLVEKEFSRKDEKGKEIKYIDKVLEFARPQNLSEDIEAIFIDEFNRSHPKVRNAVMELMQFKTINGRKFPNLKVIWGAINPDNSDNSYDIDVVDPAQLDRFHVIINLANQINVEVFTKKYNKAIAESCHNWYNKLDQSFKSFVSPRRLDYAVEHYLQGGDIREILPHKGLNIVDLVKQWRTSNDFDKFKTLISAGDEDQIKIFLGNQESYQSVLKDCLGSNEYCNILIKYALPEQILALAESEPKTANLIYKAAQTRKDLYESLNEHKKASGSYPDWFSSSSGAVLNAKVCLDCFEEQINIYPLNLGWQTEVNDIAGLVNSRALSEILDDIKSPSEVSIVSINEDSAINFLRFCKKFSDAFGISKIYEDDTNSKKIVSNKFKSLYYSSLYTFYLKDANFLGVEYEVPGVIKLINSFSGPKKLVKGKFLQEDL